MNGWGPCDFIPASQPPTLWVQIGCWLTLSPKDPWRRGVRTLIRKCWLKEGGWKQQSLLKRAELSEESVLSRS